MHPVRINGWMNTGTYLADKSLYIVIGREIVIFLRL